MGGGRVEIVFARGGAMQRAEADARASGVKIELAIADETNPLRAEWLRRIE